ncbi:hypothetical protein SAMN02745121_09103 [Nannocystis exedens]|uniref:Uncharacterized protein n=1 Tax=Nannocystis exedens TaxID=54 RepID=A0A1I2IZ11_9BACT|nr:hypothetical protein [Nannocystis exedens]PCC68167.1 hypothetical protein NAEX_01176 [Nannocystis exedens]SFF47675.1 hypothetical protein SAMN02745121_09103 [Nannocystis exedens]
MTLHLAFVLSMLAPPSEEAARAAFNAGELERALVSPLSPSDERSLVNARCSGLAQAAEGPGLGVP